MQLITNRIMYQTNSDRILTGIKRGYKKSTLWCYQFKPNLMITKAYLSFY